MSNELNCDCEHEFTLILRGITPGTEGIEEKLFEAGCDDATLAFRMGRPVLTFCRSAPSLKEAILSAIADVRKANIGAEVLRVDHCNLVTQADIARRIRRNRQTIQQYMSGKRGPGGFPGPVCEISEGSYLWAWCEVAHWLWRNDMISQNVVEDANDVHAINCVLEMQHMKAESPSLTKEIYESVGCPCE